jgi:hypothetical protein
MLWIAVSVTLLSAYWSDRAVVKCVVLVRSFMAQSARAATIKPTVKI